MGLARVGEAGEKASEEPARAAEATPEREGPRGEQRLHRGLGNRIAGRAAAGAGELGGRAAGSAGLLRVARALASEASGVEPRGLGNRAAAARVRGRSSAMVIEPAGGAGEQEADRVAAEVVRRIDAPEAGAAPTIGRHVPAPAALACAGEPAHGPEGGAVDVAVEQQIAAASGGGAGLAAGIRGPLERGFGVDLGGLRIHTGPRADDLSRSLHARAFTVGGDIFFRSGAYEPHSAAGRHLLAHEVTHAIQQGAAGGRGVVQRSVLIQRDYAGLDPLGKARVDARAEADYAKKAEDFEYRLGLHLSTCAPASEVTDLLLTKVKKIVDAWAVATKQERKAVYAQEFAFEEGQKFYGAFEMTGDAIDKVFDHLGTFGKHQPMRKRLKVIYNAVRNNNLPKWLKVAADNLLEQDRVRLARQGGDLTATASPATALRTAANVKRPDGSLDLGATTTETVAPDFAETSGLGAVLRGDAGLKGRVTAASGQEKVNATLDGGTPKQRVAAVHVAAPDMWSGLARGTAAEAGQIDAANRDRLYGQNTGVDWADQHTLAVGDVSDLTAHEIQLLRRRAGLDGGVVKSSVKKAFKAAARDKLQWEQGREAISVVMNSPVEQAATAIGARLEAGVSGSTNMMFVAAKNLGVSDATNLKKLRLAMLGWMLPNHDHSFYEIMRAAEIQGVPFVVDLARPGVQYEKAGNYEPLAVAPLQQLLPERKFPAHFLSVAHKDKIAGEIEGKAQQDAQDGIESEDTLVKYRAKVEALGLARATAQALGPRHLVEVIALAKQVHAQGFKDETVGDEPTKQKARATNQLHLRHIREGSAYGFLAHAEPTRAEVWLGQILVQQGKPTQLDHRLLIAAGEARLPALGVDAAARKKVLTDAGVPVATLGGYGEHVISDLVQVLAIVQSLGFDGAKGVTEAPNWDEYTKVTQTNTWKRITNMIPVGAAQVILMFLFRSAHGEKLAASLFTWADDMPKVKAAVALGVPDGIVARMNEAMLDGVALLGGAIDTVAGHDVGVRIAELGQLRVGHTALAAALDLGGPNRFDMIVAAIAQKKGIDLAANVHYRTLARVAASLRRSGAIDSPDQAATGFQDQGLRWAKETAEQNLGSEGRTFAGSGYEVLSAVELAAINAYTKLGGMGAWQAVLAGPDTRNTKADGAVKLAPKIQAAIAGLRKLPVYAGGPVYNAQRSDLAGRPADAMRAFAVGTVHPQDNFLSTAKEVDASFIPKAGYGVAWQIERVRTGRDISYLSTNFVEKEVLFPPGARFVVTHVEDRTDTVRFPAGHGKVWVFVQEL